MEVCDRKHTSVIYWETLDGALGPSPEASSVFLLSMHRLSLGCSILLRLQASTG